MRVAMRVSDVHLTVHNIKFCNAKQLLHKVYFIYAHGRQATCRWVSHWLDCWSGSGQLTKLLSHYHLPMVVSCSFYARTDLVEFKRVRFAFQLHIDVIFVALLLIKCY